MKYKLRLTKLTSNGKNTAFTGVSSIRTSRSLVRLMEPGVAMRSSDAFWALKIFLR